MKEYSSKNVGQRLAFVVNGDLIKAPRVKVPIAGPGLSIDPLDITVANRLAAEINSKSR